MPWRCSKRRRRSASVNRRGDTPGEWSWLVVARDALDRETLKYFVSNVSAGVLLGQLITKPDQRRIPLDRRVTEDCCHK